MANLPGAVQRRFVAPPGASFPGTDFPELDPSRAPGPDPVQHLLSAVREHADQCGPEQHGRYRQPHHHCEVFRETGRRTFHSLLWDGRFVLAVVVVMLSPCYVRVRGPREVGDEEGKE